MDETSGRVVEIRWRYTAAGERTHGATLIPGNVFGEMGLMTGAPRHFGLSA